MNSKFAAITRIALGLCLIVFFDSARAGTKTHSSMNGPATKAPGSSVPASTETLVWSDEFNGTQAQSSPDPKKWTYETGGGGWGNGELETYCAYGSNASPCNAKTPNVYVSSDGYLHIVGRRDAAGKYTSARIKTEGLAGFQYGRLEARIRIPAGEGMWPAFWMLGDSVETVGWPKCGEFDIMENIGKEPAIVHGSIHGQGFTGTLMGLPYVDPGNIPFSQGFHNYGLIWAPSRVEYYVDSPSNVYATFTPASLPVGAVWPFNRGKFFFIFNLAVGGKWPGSPNRATRFPAEMLVDYVRVWQTAPSSVAAKKE